MKTDKPEPLLKTPDDQLSQVEKYKLESNMVRGTLAEEFRNQEAGDVGDYAEQIAKSHGIYLEYNRAKTGREKDWMYMVRISVPGGGGFNREQWRILDHAADTHANANPHGGASLRITTRQNIQFHWVKKQQLIALVQDIAKTGFFTLNGCGDNVRNVMGCPLSRFSKVYNAHAKATQYGKYFQLPAAPHIQVFAVDPTLIRDQAEQYDYGPKLLNRKFKIGFSAVQRDPQTGKLVPDNCVELRTDDMGIAPVLQGEKVVGYHVYIGGGQGEKNGNATYAALGVPLGVFTEENLLKGMHDVVKVHEEWGDRKNRHWARLKYVVQAQGIDWYRDQMRAMGSTFELPDPNFDPGPRMMHHGWHKLETTGKLAYGAYIECGRLVDTEEGDDPTHQSGNVTGNGRLKSMTRAVMETFDGIELMTTANQDLLFTGIDPAAKEDFEAKLAEFGYGKRKGKTYSTLRLLSGACVGLPTCRLSYTDSEQFEPELIDELDARGYGDVNESIGITGCERQCFRPATKTIGLVGQGPDRYALKLGASEDGRWQGQYLTLDGQWYLRQVPRDKVADVCQVLFDYHKANGRNGEDLGAMLRRMGVAGVVEMLKANPLTAGLLEKTHDAPYVPDNVTFK